MAAGMGLAVRWKGRRMRGKARPTAPVAPRPWHRRMSSSDVAAHLSLLPHRRQAAQARAVLLDGQLPAVGQLLAHLGREEELHVQAHYGAEADELVGAHLALAVQDVPQPLAVDGGPPGQLRDADAARVPCLLHPHRYELRVVHSL